MISGDMNKRMKAYTNGYGSVLEIVIINQFEKGVSGANLDSEVKEFYSSMLTKSGKEALFDSKTTHVGIACGCHAQFDDYCCIAYGQNVQEKAGVKNYGEINVE